LRRFRWIAGAALTLCGCVQFRSLVQDAGDLSGTPAFEEVADSGASGAVTPFVGVDLEESLAGALDQLEFMAGLRVAAVIAGSPAEAAGIRANDRIVKADGAEMERKDQWSAFLAGKKPGESAILTIERDGGLRDVAVTVAARGAAGTVAARRFVERRKARVVVETVMDQTAGRSRALCQLVEVAPSSPLKEAGLEAGARIVALDDVALQGAGDFARRISALPYGAGVKLEVVRGDKTKSVAVTLYQPPRELTQFRFWPLFGWEESADGLQSGFEVVDLWFIWLLKYERKGETRAWSILRFISWQTGQGQLSEEPEGKGG
jgi:membrane-associated protease RseP (regulator of RpoE activity)